MMSNAAGSSSSSSSGGGNQPPLISFPAHSFIALWDRADVSRHLLLLFLGSADFVISFMLLSSRSCVQVLGPKAEERLEALPIMVRTVVRAVLLLLACLLTCPRCDAMRCDRRNSCVTRPRSIVPMLAACRKSLPR